MSKRMLILLLIIFTILAYACTKKSTTPEEHLLSPTNINISIVGENIVKLTWNDNTENETKFLIDRKEGEFSWFENFGEVAANLTSFTDNL